MYGSKDFQKKYHNVYSEDGGKEQMGCMEYSTSSTTIPGASLSY